MNYMKKNFIYTILFLVSFIINVNAKENFFAEAKVLFDNQKFEDSKFLFHRNIVFNPKDAKSYLYLAKIFKKEDNEGEFSKNLKTTLLLEPTNEEAIYMMIEFKLERSNFLEVKKLTEDLKQVCSFYCDKIVSIYERLKNFEEAGKS